MGFVFVVNRDRTHRKTSVMKYTILILSIFIGFCFAKPGLLQTEAPDYYEGEVMDGGMMPGGIATADPNEGLDAAEFIHKDLHNKQYLSNVCNYVVDEILNYSTQVVAGILTRVEYKITGNGCKDLICKAQIWEKSWMDFKEVQKYAKGLKNLKMQNFV